MRKVKKNGLRVMMQRLIHEWCTLVAQFDCIEIGIDLQIGTIEYFYGQLFDKELGIMPDPNENFYISFKNTLYLCPDAESIEYWLSQIFREFPDTHLHGNFYIIMPESSLPVDDFVDSIIKSMEINHAYCK